MMFMMSMQWTASVWCSASIQGSANIQCIAGNQSSARDTGLPPMTQPKKREGTVRWDGKHTNEGKGSIQPKGRKYTVNGR